MKKEYYQKQLEKLSILRQKATESLENAPEGHMRCEMLRGKYPQYYVMKKRNNGNRGTYIRKSEMEIAKLYAQKEYDILLLKEIERQEKLITKGINLGGMENISSVYTKIPYAKRCLITPYMLPDEEYIQKWEASFKRQENSFPIEHGYSTEKGEIVRSKSEKIIADKLYLKGIPYIYEPTVKLGNKIIFPDFVILHVKTREEIFYEHFGMMDNAEYCKKALEKIEMYEENNIHLGDKLLVSFESSLKRVNIKIIEQMIERYF